jgi:hypothetical protein
MNKRRDAYGLMTKRCDILYSFENLKKGGKKVKRILFISLAVVLALSVGLIGCGGEDLPPEAPDFINVGLTRDLDEDYAFFDWCAAGPVYRWLFENINADGGIYLSDYGEKVEINPIIRDFSMAEWDIAEVTQGLIDDGADFIWGGPGTSCIYSQAPVCAANNILGFFLEGGGSFLVWDEEIDDWPYVWLSLSFSNWYQMPVLSEMLKAEIADPKAYILYIDDQHGYEYLEAFEREFGAENVIEKVPISAAPTPKTEADTIIQNAQAALTTTPYDIFISFTYPWITDPITQAMIDNNFNPPAIQFGPGANFGYYAYSFGDAEQDIVTPPGDPSLLEGIMFYTMANQKTEVSVGTPSMTMAEMYDIMAAQLDEDVANGDCLIPLPGALLLDYWGMPCYFALGEIWVKAIEEAGNLDSIAIRDILSSYSPTNPVQTVFGDTWFEVFGDGYGGGILSYKCHTGEIGQIQSAVFETVGYDGITDVLPNYDMTADWRYPMTDKWGWLP